MHKVIMDKKLILIITVVSICMLVFFGVVSDSSSAEDAGSKSVKLLEHVEQSDACEIPIPDLDKRQLSRELNADNALQSVEFDAY
jgi:hypothetical protein